MEIVWTAAIVTLGNLFCGWLGWKVGRSTVVIIEAPPEKDAP